MDSVLSQGKSSSFLTTLFGTVWSHFIGSHSYTNQNVQISPVVKGSQAEYQMSKNQFDDYQEDINKLVQRYDVILANLSLKNQQIEMSRWRKERNHLRRLITLDYRKTHVLNKPHYNLLLNRIKSIGSFAQESHKSKVNRNGKNVDDILLSQKSLKPMPTKVNLPTMKSQFFPQQSLFETKILNDSIDIEELDGQNGFIAYGIGPHNYTGHGVSGAGDFNGDMIKDAIICAGGHYDGPTPLDSGQRDLSCVNPGACYVLFGQEGNFNASIHLSDLANLNGFVIKGEDICDGTGISVDSAGDINGDSIDDIVIGSPYAYDLQHQKQVGAAYVVFGRNTSNGDHFDKTFFLSNLDGKNGFKMALNSSLLIAEIGYSVTSGDLNGDNITDIAIGAPSNSAINSTDSYVSRCYVIYGKNTFRTIDKFEPIILLDTLNGKDGFIITPNDRFQLGVGSALSMGDVNGDKIADLLISGGLRSTISANKSSECCLFESFLVFGKKYRYPEHGFQNPTILDHFNGTDGFRIAVTLNYASITDGADNGQALSNAGDINGDGLDDLVIYALNTGYVIFGQKKPYSPNLNLDNAINFNGFSINFFPRLSLSRILPGYSISTNGDLNADGVNDLVFSGYGGKPSASNGVYVLLGKNSSFSRTIDAENNEQGFWISNTCHYSHFDITNCSENFGISISSAGDINQDGYSDLLVGASLESIDGTIGKCVVIFGGQYVYLPPSSEDISDHDNNELLYFLYGGAGGSIIMIIITLSFMARKLYQRWQDNPPFLLYHHQKASDKKEPNIEMERIECKPLLSSDLPINFGRDKVDSLEQTGKEEEIETQLDINVTLAVSADKKNELEEAAAALSKVQSRPNETLLQKTIRTGCVNLAKQLLQDGVDPNEAPNNSLRPIDLVKLYKYSAALEGPIHRAIKQYKHDQHQENRFQQALNQLPDNNINTIHYIVDEQMLRNFILNLTTTDAIGKAISEIEQAKNKLSKSERKAISHLIKPLMQRIVRPYKLIKREKSIEDFFRNFISNRKYNYIDTVFSKLEQLRDDVIYTQEKIPGDEVYNSIHQALGAVGRIYDNYMKQVTEAETPAVRERYLNPKATVRGANLDHRELKYKAEKLLVHSSHQTDVSQGTHIVKAMGGIHFKANPYAPGVEFMVNSLVNLIVGYGVPPTQLLKVCYENTSQIYLASKTVEGFTLDFILDKHPELIDKIDSYNFSSMVVLGLLTNPQDGKADNYMVKLWYDKLEATIKIDIIGIDNDIAFADSIVESNRGEEHYVNVKNILYFLPQMKHSINDRFRKTFVDMSPNIIIIKWLESLAKKNREYSLLQQQGVFSSDELKQLGLPIRLVPGLVSQLYQKIKTIQAKLRTQPKITHNQLFETIDPILYKYYRNIHNNSSISPLESISQLYFGSSAVEKVINPQTQIHGGTLLTKIVHKQAKIYDFEDNRIRSICEATEEFMQSLNFSHMTEMEQHKLLIYLAELDYIKHFRITGCSVVDFDFLARLIDKRSNISHLSFTNCKNIKEESLPVIEAKCRGVKHKIEVTINGKSHSCSSSSTNNSSSNMLTEANSEVKGNKTRLEYQSVVEFRHFSNKSNTSSLAEKRSEEEIAQPMQLTSQIGQLS